MAMIDQIKQRYPIRSYLEGRGYQFRLVSGELKTICLFHEDKDPSMSINEDKQVFFCFTCKAKGNIVTLVAKVNNWDEDKAYKVMASTIDDGQKARTPAPAPKAAPMVKKAPRKAPLTGDEVAAYDYKDATSRLVFQVLRYEPPDKKKFFRQRHVDRNGEFWWGLDGVTRVLYRLPQVLAARQVWVVEGEKDADNLCSLGYTATACACGSSAWMDGYVQDLEGREIILCGDNDDAGKDFVNDVLESVAGKVKSVTIVTVPEPSNDITDYIEACDGNKALVEALVDESPILTRGLDLPIYNMKSMEARYRTMIEKSGSACVDLSKWLPSLSRYVRKLYPGEVATVVADTGVGKSMALQNISHHVNNVDILFFEIELPDTLMFERFAAMNQGVASRNVEKAYENGKGIQWTGLDHVFVCPVSRLTVEDIENYIIKSELVIGRKPGLVMVDYIGLIRGKGSRYERLSDAAEDLKVIAKATGTVFVIASQVSRKGKDESSQEIFLHDAKDTGSIENSCGLMIGLWKEAPDHMVVKILKSTKGGAGYKIDCDFDGECMRITERVPDYWPNKRSGDRENQETAKIS